MSNYPFATPQTGAHANAPNATVTNTNTHTPILPPTLGTVQLLDRERERTPLTMAGTAPHGQTHTQTQSHAVSAPTATAATVSGQSLSAVQANGPPSMSRPGSSAAGGVGGVGVVSGTSTQSMESALYGLFPSSSLCFVLEAMVKRLERFSQLDSYSSIRVSTAQELNDELLLDERMRRPDVQSAMPRTIPTPKSIQKLEKLRRHYEICPSLLSFIQTQAANMTQFSAYPYSFSQHFAPLPTFQQRRYQFTAANLLSMTLQNKLGSECQEMIRSAMQHPKCSLNIQQLSSFRPYVQHHQVYSVSAQSAAAVAASSTTSSMLLDPAISELHVWREVHIEKENDVFGIPTPSVTNSAASISTSASALEIYHCLWYGRPPPTHARYSSSLRPMKAFSVNDVHAFLVAFPTLQFQYEWLEEGLLFEESDGLEVRIFVIYRLQRPAELKSAEKMKSLEGKYFLSVKCIQESEKFPEADQNVNEYAKELQQWVQFTKYTPTFT